MSASSPKLVVSNLETSAVGSVGRTSRHGNRQVVYFLDSISQHWTVALREDIRSDFCDVVGANPENVRVECRVMNLAECQSIRHDWLAADFGAIWDDMGSIEQLHMAQLADSARCSVSTQDDLPEARLMEANKR